MVSKHGDRKKKNETDIESDNKHKRETRYQYVINNNTECLKYKQINRLIHDQRGSFLGCKRWFKIRIPANLLLSH